MTGPPERKDAGALTPLFGPNFSSWRGLRARPQSLTLPRPQQRGSQGSRPGRPTQPRGPAGGTPRHCAVKGGFHLKTRLPQSNAASNPALGDAENSNPCSAGGPGPGVASEDSGQGTVTGRDRPSGSAPGTDPQLTGHSSLHAHDGGLAARSGGRGAGTGDAPGTRLEKMLKQAPHRCDSTRVQRPDR